MSGETAGQYRLRWQFSVAAAGRLPTVAGKLPHEGWEHNPINRSAGASEALQIPVRWRFPGDFNTGDLSEKPVP